MKRRGNPAPWVKKADELLKPFLSELQPYAVAFRYPDEQAAPAEAR